MQEEQVAKTGVRKRFMYVNRRPPHGTIFALECLELILVTAAFDQDQCVAFMDDGVFALKKHQDPATVGMKDFSRTYRALDDYDVEKIYVEKESLDERGLSEADLVIPVTVLTRGQLRRIMGSQDVVISA